MKEFRVCSSCGYSRGFHVYFKETEDGTTIGLVCPNCGQSFDLGWKSSAEIKPEKGLVFSSQEQR